MRRSRAVLAALAAAVAVLMTAPAGAGALTVGIADQKTAMFEDPRFHDLGVRHARYVVPWDVLSERWSREELHHWLTAARRSGVRPLLTFGHSRRPGLRRMLPTVRRLHREFRRLRARYPWVRQWATWNEPNHCGEPTCKHPKLVARYHDALRRTCRTCTILAAEVLDMPNMASWVRRFTRAAEVEPRWWGLHNYIDANRFRTRGTRTLLRVTRGNVWLTETGGVLRRQDRRHRVEFPGGAHHAARATRWIFTKLVPLDRRRITRVYLYHWNSSTPVDTWDSALISASGRPRAALRVLADVLDGLRVKARARARAQARSRARARTQARRGRGRGRSAAADVATTVAVISDTHLPRGRRQLPDGCLERLRAADLVLHAGDLVGAEVMDLLDGLGVPWLGVHGNVDRPEVRERLPEVAEVDVEQVRIGMVHDAGPAAGRLARLQRRFPACDLVVFGHSHIPLHAHDALGDLHLLNPGSPTDRRRQPRHTMAVVRVDGQDLGVEVLPVD